MALLDVTQAAADKARKLLASSGFADGALRIGVKNGGCSGMRYELAFDDQVGDDDTQLEFFGLRVVVDAESARFLEGVTVDFSDDLNDAGFKIDHPSAEETCGCGESFSLVR